MPRFSHIRVPRLGALLAASAAAAASYAGSAQAAGVKFTVNCPAEKEAEFRLPPDNGEYFVTITGCYCGANAAGVKAGLEKMGRDSVESGGASASPYLSFEWGSWIDAGKTTTDTMYCYTPDQVRAYLDAYQESMKAR